MVEIPFKMHNSEMVNEPEDQRDRSWFLNVSNLQMRSIPNNSIEDVYEKLQIDLLGIELLFGKRDYPKLLKVIEQFDVNLLIKIKSKLKTMLKKGEQNENEVECMEPELVITTADGKALKELILNLTPDSYNALVNITSVLMPEKTKQEITRQFNEKQSIVNSSLYKRSLPTVGVRETRLTTNW
jgi:maltodextrin utilization protein YvdJ